MIKKNQFKIILKKISPRLTIGYILYDFLTPVPWLSYAVAFLSIIIALAIVAKKVALSSEKETFFEINTFTLFIFSAVFFFGSPNERSVLAKNINQIKKIHTYLRLVDDKKKELKIIDQEYHNKCTETPSNDENLIYAECGIIPIKKHDEENSVTKMNHEEIRLNIEKKTFGTKFDCMVALSSFQDMNLSQKKLILKNGHGLVCELTKNDQGFGHILIRREIVKE